MGVQRVNDEDQFESVPESDGGVVQLPFPLYTWILLGCIAVVFIAQYLTTTETNFLWTDERSADYAGFVKADFIKGEYWRILTGATIHLGLIHAVMNSYALFNLGRLVELLSNRAHVAIVFILSAIGGGLLSLWLNPTVDSAGASGGIIGLISYLAVYAFKRRKFISAEFRKSLLVNIVFILLYGLVLYQLIDNFAHIGGLIIGAIYGLIQIPSDEYVDPREASRITKVAGFACLVIYAITCCLSILLLFNAR